MSCVQTWEACRQGDVFHLLYDWLLVLLQERLLSSSQDTQVDSVISAWYHMFWVAALTSLLLLTSGARLVWIALRWFLASGEPAASVASHGYKVDLQALHLHV